jgi:CRISPR-associated protein Cas1
MPWGPDESARARRQVRIWSDVDRRVDVARRMYAWRLGEVLPVRDMDSLRGIEGARVKKSYQLMAERHGIPWTGRRYDRANPAGADIPNQCINHASTALEAVALVAVAVSGAIPQLGFIHEDSGVAFPLDISDLFRESIMLPIAFGAARRILSGEKDDLEREIRYEAAVVFRREQVVARMIDRVKDILDADDRVSHE